MSTQKQQIAVLGGGLGSLSAAFYLTEQEGWADKYEITVYQQGWRLGGKCASGHDMRPGYGHRIYEHGLHIFGGFYYYAFDLLRRAYKALARPEGHPNQDVWDAFTPEDGVALVDDSSFARDHPIWYVDFPPNIQVPGDNLTLPSVGDSLQALIQQLLHWSPKTGSGTTAGPGTPSGPSQPDDPPGTASPLREALDALKTCFEQIEQKVDQIEIEWFFYRAIHMIEQHTQDVKKQDISPDDQLTFVRFLLSAYLVQTILMGVIADKVWETGYDALDIYELSEWLKKNAITVANMFPEWGPAEPRAQLLIDWTPIKSAYDYVFGYGDGGDESKRTFAAGTALRSFLLMSVGYKGHFFWKMKGAMGDVVIAPLYLALKQRGVKFRFFSRITALNPDPTEDRIASVDYVEQAQLTDPSHEYTPLIDVPLPGWPKETPLEGWPATPLWHQLADGDRLKAEGRDFEADHKDAPGDGDIARELVAGRDFDKIVLGISVGGLKQVCASFPARLPTSKWQAMFEALTLTRTCAMQLWFRRTVDDLGCKEPDRTLAGAKQPYSAWADMSHLLSRETWKGEERPLGITYFCGQIPGPENGKAADEKARRTARQWLGINTALYWPRAMPKGANGLDTTLLFDPEPEAGGSVFDRQYVRANTNPSDLYVQSPSSACTRGWMRTNQALRISFSPATGHATA